MPPNHISPSLEDYLEVILSITEKSDKVRVTDLSTEMNVAKSSVNQAVQKLVDLGLVSHEKYGPLELTSVGKRQAESVKKRHRLLKEFLVQILGVDADTAEKDACNIEHYISATTIEKLISFLAEGTERFDRS